MMTEIMITNHYVELIALAILLTGLFKVFSKFFKLKRSVEFAQQYLLKFINLSNSYDENSYNFNGGSTFDPKLYAELTLDVHKIDNMLGSIGEMHYIVGPLSIPRYRVILNTLPKFRERSLQSFDVNSSQNCLLRFIGVQLETLKTASRDLLNPLIWFREGMNEVVSLPVTFLYYFGLIKSRNAIAIKNSYFTKFISFIISLVVLLSGIVTILVGSEKSINLMKALFRIE